MGNYSFLEHKTLDRYKFSEHKKCPKCFRIDTYYEGEYIKFPIKCKCGGYIHIEDWGFDDGYDYATYYKIKCFKCGKEREFRIPDYAYELIEELYEFFKKEE